MNEMSPIAETVLLSEDQIPFITGGNADDGISDFSNNTPISDNRNSNHYLFIID